MNDSALIVACFNLLFPINIGARVYFLNMTGRFTPDFYDVNFFVDLAACVLTSIWIYDRKRFEIPQEGNMFIDLYKHAYNDTVIGPN